MFRPLLASSTSAALIVTTSAVLIASNPVRVRSPRPPRAHSLMAFMNSVDDSAPSVSFTLDILSVALILASLLYAFCLLLVRRKLIFLNRVSPGELGTKKLLVLSVGLVCIIRIMAFIGVAAMDISNVRAHYSLRPVERDGNNKAPATRSDKNQGFYDAAMTVLFDLPNCVIVSTYVLLALVWAECFLMSRFHNLSTFAWKKRSLLYYMIFNAILYFTQLLLYVLVVAGTASGVVRSVLYAASPGINFGAVILVLILYVYLNMSFSGFPFRSIHSRESLRKISNVMALWSVTRIVWGSGMLIVFLANVELLQDSKTPVWSAVILFLLLVVCEVLPIVVMLDYSYMNIVGFESGASRDMSALASGQRAFEEGDDGGDDCSSVQQLNWKGQSGDLYGQFATSAVEPLLEGGEVSSEATIS